MMTKMTKTMMAMMIVIAHMFAREAHGIALQASNVSNAAYRESPIDRFHVQYM